MVKPERVKFILLAAGTTTTRISYTITNTIAITIEITLAIKNKGDFLTAIR